MRKIIVGSFLASGLCFAQGLDGRWDLTINTPKGTYPSWMEVTSASGQPSVRVVGRVASAHPAKDVHVSGNKLTFSSQESFAKQIPVEWEFHLEGDKLKGTQKRSDGVTGSIEGERAPALNRPRPAAWSKPKPIFNGKNLSGWTPDDPAKNHWVVQNGELVNEAPGANLRTDNKFQDFKLHLEFNCPQEGNSGIYLRGRYETQIEYQAADLGDPLHGMASIYGFIPPSVTVKPSPGQWESLDITLVGRTVTLVRNGTTIIDAQQIPGITGGALNSKEGEPGPFYIQGDHTGGMKYRNITIAVPAS